MVKVEGNVYNPGFVAHPGGVMSMSKAIELAGGYKPNSLKTYLRGSSKRRDRKQIFLEEGQKEYSLVIKFLSRQI